MHYTVLLLKTCLPKVIPHSMLSIQTHKLFSNYNYITYFIIHELLNNYIAMHFEGSDLKANPRQTINHNQNYISIVFSFENSSNQVPSVFLIFVHVLKGHTSFQLEMNGRLFLRAHKLPV